MKNQLDEDSWMTVSEVVAYTGVSEYTIRKACKSGELKSLPGGGWGPRKMQKREVDRWKNAMIVSLARSLGFGDVTWNG